MSGLNDLTKEPFSLRMILEIGPIYLKKYSQKMTRFQLYSEFSDQWFTKEFNRLNTSGNSEATLTHHIFNVFNQYCIDLACTMKEKNTVVMDMNNSKEWDQFFYDENTQKFKEKNRINGGVRSENR